MGRVVDLEEGNETAAVTAAAMVVIVKKKKENREFKGVVRF